MHFTKSHALGNDYIVLVEKELQFQLNKKNIQLICDRHLGIGADGILLLTDSNKADFGFRIFNPDGSEAEKSGNGLRIFTKFLYERGYTKKEKFSIDTKGGITTAAIRVDNGKIAEIMIEMGKASFNSKEIPVAGEEREVVGEKLTVGDKNYTFTCVGVGNPHCVILKEKLDVNELRKYGPLLENHKLFPNHINVQFAKVLSNNEVEILIWERGVGETTASGSSACAVAAAVVKNNLTNKNVTIRMQGGRLKISIDDNWNITMTGPASEVYTGKLSEEFLELLK